MGHGEGAEPDPGVGMWLGRSGLRDLPAGGSRTGQDRRALPGPPWSAHRAQMFCRTVERAASNLRIGRREVETSTHTKTCAQKLEVTSSIIMKYWKQPRCPSTGRWTNSDLAMQQTTTQPEREQVTNTRSTLAGSQMQRAQ